MGKAPENFDISILEHLHVVSLGKLPQEMIDFINEKAPEFGSLLSGEQDILFWEDRVAHTMNHKDDFFSDVFFHNCVESLPDFIQNPDFIAVSKKNKSLSFIKVLSQTISVAVRVSANGKLAYRTMYPISSAQLNSYIKKNSAWKYK